MDAAHAHLVLNHLPILGTFFGMCLLVYGLFMKKRELENAGFVTLIIVTLLTVPAFFTGEAAEESVEQLSGVSRRYMEMHEELSETAIWLMVATGVASLATLMIARRRRNQNMRFRIVPLVLAAVTFGIMVMVGNYGGKIRHSELRGDGVERMQQHKEKDQDKTPKTRERDEAHYDE